MARIPVAALGGLVALGLNGCGSPSEDDTKTTSPGVTAATTTQHVTTATTTSPGPAPYTTAPPTPGKTPLYVVMRMDDVNPVDHDNVLADVIDWFLDHKVKYNFGVIVGKDPTDEWSPYWPTTCADKSSDMYCDSKTVQAVQKAYDNGDIVGTGQDAVLEMGSHSWSHEAWPSHLGADEQDDDFNKSMSTLTALYPKASIKYFAPPQNAANANTIATMKKHGLSILSAAATRKCGADNDPAAAFYLTSPCQDSSSPYEATCGPENDIWATTDGFSQVEGITSAPAGSANSYWTGGGQEGISVDETLGENDCGCLQKGSGGGLRVWCSIIGSARNNAAKSHGLHWTVNMMHPQTVFPDHDQYTDWLDDFYSKAMALKDWDVRFINYQDLARIPAPGAVADVTI